MYRSIFKPGLFQDKLIVVTGGGSGIGRCTAHELASLGAKLALVGRSEAKLCRVSDEISRLGHVRPLYFSCDIREEAAVRDTVRAILDSGEPIAGLVNNAGGQFMSPLAGISAKGFDAVVRNNLTGGFLFSREVFTQCMHKCGGAIVNVIADMWRSMPGLGHSGAARAGMLNLTQTAAVEWAHAGVRVNAVAPGFIASDGLNRYPEEARPYLRRMKEAVPLQRLGTESEVSAAIVFLLSDAAAFVSGSCLRVDGAAPNARLDWPLEPHSRAPEYHGFPGESVVSFRSDH